MSAPSVDAAADALRLRRCLLAMLGFVTLLWLIKLVELALQLDLTHYGIYPGRLRGLAGVLLAPLIHGSLTHLFSNTLPLLILGTALLYGYPRAARVAIPVLYLGSGLAVWLFGRNAWHIGASGLTFGMLFFILTSGILRWDSRAIALALVVFLLYGGMLWGIFPGAPSVSFESHLAGALIGLLLALTLRRRDPLPARRRYSWEDDEDDSEPEPWPPPDWREPEPRQGDSGHGDKRPPRP